MPEGTAAGGAIRGPIARRQTESAADPARPVTGPVRKGRRTKDLIKELQLGEIALVHHADLDRIASEDLSTSGIVAVINCASSSTGRYPNVGPLILADAGIVLIDAPDENIFDAVEDGDVLTIEGGEIRRGDEVLGDGLRPTIDEIRERLSSQRDRINVALAEFATNTLEHVREESALLSGELDLPETRTRFSGRHVLVVVRGPGYREDLAALDAYLRDVRPLIVAVDGGADAVLERGMTPEVILGDMDSATDKALRCGAELIVHAYPDGRAPGRERLQEAELDHLVIPAAGTSQDVAMLLAHEKGAELIVSVGAHYNLTEFLDKNRAGMSSTFLTRLRVGETLIDAKGVSRLYQPGMGKGGAAMFVAAFLLLLVIVIIASPGLDNVAELIWIKIKDAIGA